MINNLLISNNGISTKKQRLVNLISLLLSLVLSFATVFIFLGDVSFEGNESVAYPLEDSVADYNPYIQQFDAFMKGQTNIDYEPSEQLLEIDNPYDPAERKGVYYLYDRAYYDGQYFSYFGTAPIFTVMFPCYLLSGSLPSDASIQLAFALLFALFMTLTVFMLCKRLAPRVPSVFVCLLSYAANISSLHLLYARGRLSFYYIAATSAMAFAAAFAYFFFRGLFANRAWVRTTLFALSGLCFALCFHSRINTALSLAFFIIPAVIFGIILKKRAVCTEGGFLKKHGVGSIAIELSALAFFVIIGFVLAFIYNKARFDSIFEFGAKYQLTVGDATKYKLETSELGCSVFHYFLAPLRRTEEGLKLAYYSFDIQRYLYVDAHFGILELPLAAAAFICPFAFTSKSKSRMFRYTNICALLGCFVLVWIDFCLGGVIFRYLCDISGILAALGALGIMLLLDKICTLKSKAIKYILYALVALFVVISIYKAFRIMSITNVNLLPLAENSLFHRF